MALDGRQIAFETFEFRQTGVTVVGARKLGIRNKHGNLHLAWAPMVRLTSWQVLNYPFLVVISTDTLSSLCNSLDEF